MDKISPTKWGWLKQTDTVQCEWVLKYLRRKILVPITTSTPDYRTITSLFESWPNDAEHREKLNQTKRAWKTHKTREAQVDSKQYNFTLPIRVRKHLDALAKQTKQTINKTLEMLIEERYEGSKTAKPKTAIKVKKANNASSQSSSITENESGVVAAEAEKMNNTLPQTSLIPKEENDSVRMEAEQNSSLPSDNPPTESGIALIDTEEKTSNPPPKGYRIRIIDRDSHPFDITPEEISAPAEPVFPDNLDHTTADISEHVEHKEQTIQSPQPYTGPILVDDKLITSQEEIQALLNWDSKKL